MKIYKLGQSIVIGERQTAINNVAIAYLTNAISIAYSDGGYTTEQKVLFTDILDSGGLPVGSDKATVQAYFDTEIFSSAAAGGGADSKEAKQDVQIANQETMISQNKRFRFDQSGSLTVSQRKVLASLVQHNGNLPLLYDRRNGGGATQTFQNNQVQMSVTGGTDYAVCQTFQYYEYFSGKPIRAEFTVTDFGIQANVEKSFGQYHDQRQTAPYTTNFDGYRLHNDGTTHRIQIFRAGTTVLDLPRANWDDPLDGTGASGITIDFDLFNIFIFDYLWLGGSGLRLFINIGGEIIPVHNYRHANNADNVIFEDPEQPVRYEIRSTGGAGSMQQICASVSLETGIDGFGKRYGIDRGDSFINANVVGTQYALLGIRVSSSDYHTSVIIDKISALAATADNFIISVLHNPTVAGDALVWTNLSNTAIDYCIPNDTNTVTGGVKLYSGYVSSAGSLSEGLDNLLRLGTNLDGVADQQFLVITPLGTNLDVFGSVIMKEV